MKQETFLRQETSKIPIVTDVIRLIDGIQMVRCSYYSIQSDSPIDQWSNSLLKTNRRILLLSLEAIITGPIEYASRFDTVAELESVYDFADMNEGLFIDINDIWVPHSWFGRSEVNQGLVFRIAPTDFVACWQMRHDKISTEAFSKFIENRREAFIEFSEQETIVFEAWTKKQIEQSRDIYKSNRTEYLKKIFA